MPRRPVGLAQVEPGHACSRVHPDAAAGECGPVGDAEHMVSAAGAAAASVDSSGAADRAAQSPPVTRRQPAGLWDGTLPNLARNANRSEHLLINTDGTLFVEWTSGGASAAAGQTARYFAQGSYRLT